MKKVAWWTEKVENSVPCVREMLRKRHFGKITLPRSVSIFEKYKYTLLLLNYILL